MLLTTFLAFSLLQANDSLPHYKQEVKVNIEVEQLQTDVLGNVYVLNSNTLTKLTSEGKQLCHYTNNQLGFPASFDCSDPLNIQLFYPDQNKVVFLDKSLSQLNEAISLDVITNSSPLAICNSTRASFWILNKQELRLQCFDRNLKLTVQSQQLNDIIRTTSQCKLYESENQIVLLVKSKGIYLFDRFGGLQRFFPESKAEFALIRDNILYISTKQFLSRIEILTGKKTTIPNFHSDMFMFPLLNNKIIAFNQAGFIILSEL